MGTATFMPVAVCHASQTVGYLQLAEATAESGDGSESAYFDRIAYLELTGRSTTSITSRRMTQTESQTIGSTPSFHAYTGSIHAKRREKTVVLDIR